MSEEKPDRRGSRRKNSFWARVRRKNIKSLIKIKKLKETKELEKIFETQMGAQEES